LLDSHDTIVGNDTCVHSDVEMQDSENKVAPVSQSELFQDVGSALWDVPLENHESVRDDPNFSFRKADSHAQNSDISAEDTCEIEEKVFEEVIFKRKRKKAKKAMQPVEQFASIHVSLVLYSCKGFWCPFTGKNHVTLCVWKRKDFRELAKISPKFHDDEQYWNFHWLLML